MKMDTHRVGKLVGEQMVFDHLRGHPHQRQRVLVKTARVAAHVERADDAAVGVGDGRARAGEDAIRVKEVFVGMHDRRLTLDQRRADRVGAAVRLGPRDART